MSLKFIYIGGAISVDLTLHSPITLQRLEGLTLSQGLAMKSDDTVHVADDVYFVGILIIALFSMMIGFLMGFLIASWIAIGSRRVALSLVNY